MPTPPLRHFRIASTSAKPRDVSGNSKKTPLRQLLSFILTVFLLADCAAQTKQIHIPKDKQGDTLDLYKRISETKSLFHLTPIENSTDSFHIRIWWGNEHFVDLWTTDKKKDCGQSISYIYPCNPVTDSPRPKRRPIAYYTKSEFTKKTVTQSYNLLKSIINIPTDDSIKNWNVDNDNSSTLVLEISTPTQYIFKKWTAIGQERTYGRSNEERSEEATILKFIQDLKGLLQIKEEYDRLFDVLPKGYYCLSGHFTSTQIMYSKYGLFKRMKVLRKTKKDKSDD